MGRVTFTAVVKIPDAGHFGRVARRVRPVVTEEITAADPGIERVTRRAAPRGKTRALERGIRGRMKQAGFGDPVLEIGSTVRSKTDGYPYTGVTRFGTKKEWIEPVRRGFRASVIATGKLRAKKPRATLRFVIGGRVLYRRRVRGYHPSHDWVADADRNAQPLVKRASERVGSRLTSELAG